MRLHIREMGGGHRTTEAHVAGRTMLAGLASFENHYKLISYLSLFFKSLTFFPLSTCVYFFSGVNSVLGAIRSFRRYLP